MPDSSESAITNRPALRDSVIRARESLATEREKLKAHTAADRREFRSAIILQTSSTMRSPTSLKWRSRTCFQTIPRFATRSRSSAWRLRSSRNGALFRRRFNAPAQTRNAVGRFSFVRTVNPGHIGYWCRARIQLCAQCGSAVKCHSVIPSFVRV